MERQLEQLTELVREQGRKLDHVVQQLAEQNAHAARLEERIAGHVLQHSGLKESVDELWGQHRALEGRVGTLENARAGFSIDRHWWQAVLWKAVVPLAMLGIGLLIANKGG